MNDDELRSLLEELHRKVETTSEVDEKGRELLSHLSLDIQNLLEKTKHEEGLGDSTREIDRIERTIRHFEVTHPSLTAALSQLLNILNNAGI